LPSQPGFFKPSNEYVEKHFTLRIQRRDGTSKLLLGVTGSLPKLGSIKEIKLAQDEVLKVKVVDHLAVMNRRLQFLGGLCGR
jgi:esterase/lipase superfamily enzyme